MGRRSDDRDISYSRYSGDAWEDEDRRYRQAGRSRGHREEPDDDWDDDSWEDDSLNGGTAGKGSSGKKRGGFGTFVITLLLIIAVGVFVYSGYRLIGYYLAYKAGTDEYSSLNDDYINMNNQPDTAAQPESEEMSESEAQAGALTDVTLLEDPDTLQDMVDSALKETVTENNEEKSLPVLVNPVDFEELQAVNEDIIGWIRVGAVNISYPVAQAEDNDYYLHRTFKRVDNFAGCIFENCENSSYFTDQNTIIYGHNMKNGSMFGRLKEFSEQETLDSNPYFWMFTPDYIYQYRIFSSSIVSRIGDPYVTRFREEDFQNFINTSFASSEIDCGDVSVTTSDRVMTLSTCTGDDSTRRIVQGVLVQVYAPA